VFANGKDGLAMAAQRPRYLTVNELAEYLNVKPETLTWWRKQCPPRGPRHKKFGNGVRYPMAEIAKYEEDPQAYDRERALEITL
jgi:hypothetical protein